MIPLIRRIYTLIFVQDVANKKILLGYKKRGFGMNKWNGLGGKLEPGETLEECAKRETKEESGLDVISLEQVGFLEFQFESKMNETLEANIFTVDKYEGEIRECDEMLPKWFDIDKIPFDNMWKDDRFWVTKLIDGKYFKGYFLFKDDEETIIEQKLDTYDTKSSFLKALKSQ